MISVVVPVYNENESLQAFYSELIAELRKIPEKYEIIFVDDGSTDNSLEILKELEGKDNAVRIFSFRKNQGKAYALTAGFQKAIGEYVVTLDADLQDKPSEIHKLLEKLQKEHLDMVSGWRKNRKDKSRMIVISYLFNYFTGKLFGVRLHDYNCGLKVYKVEAAKSLRLYGGQHRFIPLLLVDQGFSVDEAVVVHEKRKFGKSKYGFSKVWKDLPDIFTMLFLVKYGKRPLHFFGPVGSILSLMGFSILTYLSLLKIITGVSIGGRPLLMFGILLVISGLQTFFTGFIGELIVSTSQKEIKVAPLKYSSI